jgi:hypothetical protein
MQALNKMKNKKKVAKSAAERELEAQAFVTRMEEAATFDVANLDSNPPKPAVHKLNMLSEVISVLNKKDIIRALLDYDLLSAVKHWVEPRKGKLGNLTIRKELLKAVSKLNGENPGITKEDLKTSELGHVIMRLYMHKKEIPEMKRLMRKLIDHWAAPIFQNSTSYKSLQHNQQQQLDSGFVPKAVQQVRVKKTSGFEERDAAKAETTASKSSLEDIIKTGVRKKESEGQNASSRVRVPFSEGFQYTVRPEKREDAAVQKFNSSRKPKEGGIQEKLQKKMLSIRQEAKKNPKVGGDLSVEGRRVK